MRVPTRRYDVKQKKVDPYITQEKAKQYKVDLEKMIKIIRPKLANEVAELAQLGDFSENAAYQMAKGKLRGLNNKILRLENILNNSIIIKTEKNSDTVNLGNKVTVKTGENQYTYQILGSQETNPSQGIISHLSPIGSALLGCKLGEEVKVEINDRIIKYKIIKID